MPRVTMSPLRLAAAWVALQALLLLLPSTARAALIRDGDDFSMTFDPPGARVCVIFPVAARDPVACAGLSLPAGEAPKIEQRIVASGIIRFDDGGDGYSALFSVTYGPMPDATEPDLKTAQEFGTGMSNGVALNAKGNTRSGWPRTELRTLNDRPAAARISSYLDGLTDERKRLMEHFVGYAVWVEGGAYAFMLMSGGDRAAAIDALADDSARSISFSHPAPPRQSREYRIGYALGEFLAWGIMGVGGLVLAFVLTRRGRKPNSVAAPTPPGPLS
jgi:hypothetical protein